MARRAGIEHRVFFPGPLYGADKVSALADADVMASPGPFEIFGLTAFEAILCGTPVVVCRESGQGQVIAQGGAGLTVPGGDDEAVEKAIKQILTRPREAQQRTAQGQAFIRQRLDWKVLIEELIRVYESVLAQAMPSISERV